MIKYLLRFLLYPFTLLYGAIVWLRNRLYDSGFMSSVSFDLPVIAVGNLSVGGTGKTPHVEYLVRLLQYEYRIATMSRGYKRRTRGFVLAGPGTNALHIGDEPMQYHLKFPDLAVSVAEERMTGIPYLVQRRPDTEVILLDDAYQHRSVQAGRNILITDYARPFYDDYILPYGRLREGRKAYQRADIIIVSKCPENLGKEEAARIRQRIAPLATQQVFFSYICYGQAYDFFSREPVSFAGKQVLLISGIAKPQPLEQRVMAEAAKVHLLSYPDHHFFTARNFEEIRSTIANWGGDVVIVTTEKDATRLHLKQETLMSLQVPVIVLPIEVRFLFGEGPLFDTAIQQFVANSLERTDTPLIEEEDIEIL